MQPKSLTIQVLALAACLTAGLSLAQPASASAAFEPREVGGPCRVKLRTGRQIDASALRPADDSGSFWRLELPGGGSVVLPVRELRGVELLALVSQEEDEATVASPPSEFFDAEPRSATCDPVSSSRLARWDEVTAAAALRHGVDHSLVRAIIAVESCGNPSAVSPKGALGLMQLMPATARDYGCPDPRDPQANVEAGVRHLKRLIAKLDGDIDLVLAAYNAGEGAVAKAGGIPAFRETRNYVRSVKRHLSRLGSSAASM